jgi:hypothetical protein
MSEAAPLQCAYQLDGLIQQLLAPIERASHPKTLTGGTRSGHFSDPAAFLVMHSSSKHRTGTQLRQLSHHTARPLPGQTVVHLRLLAGGHLNCPSSRHTPIPEGRRTDA